MIAYGKTFTPWLKRQVKCTDKPTRYEVQKHILWCDICLNDFTCWICDDRTWQKVGPDLKDKVLCVPCFKNITDFWHVNIQHKGHNVVISRGGASIILPNGVFMARIKLPSRKPNKKQIQKLADQIVQQHEKNRYPI